MARNKYPEQTVERILEVSTRLFFQNGYENTSVQDILNELGDLTKGAIYHHFKSKEDIFDAVVSKLGQGNNTFLNSVKQDTKLNGNAKLKKLVSLCISSSTTKDVIEISPNLLDNPKFLSTQLKEVRDVVTPQYIAPIIEEGVADGSICCDKPYELAEAITLLINVWINPLILGSDKSKISSKCKIINEFVAQYNLTLFDNETIQYLEKL